MWANGPKTGLYARHETNQTPSKYPEFSFCYDCCWCSYAKLSSGNVFWKHTRLRLGCINLLLSLRFPLQWRQSLCPLPGWLEDKYFDSYEILREYSYEDQRSISEITDILGIYLRINTNECSRYLPYSHPKQGEKKKKMLSNTCLKELLSSNPCFCCFLICIGRYPESQLNLLNFPNLVAIPISFWVLIYSGIYE